MWEQWVYVRLGNSKREWEEHRARNQEVWILVILLAVLSFGHR